MSIKETFVLFPEGFGQGTCLQLQWCCKFCKSLMMPSLLVLNWPASELFNLSEFSTEYNNLVQTFKYRFQKKALTCRWIQIFQSNWVGCRSDELHLGQHVQQLDFQNFEIGLNSNPDPGVAYAEFQNRLVHHRKLPFYDVHTQNILNQEQTEN